MNPLQLVSSCLASGSEVNGGLMFKERSGSGKGAKVGITACGVVHIGIVEIWNISYRSGQ